MPRLVSILAAVVCFQLFGLTTASFSQSRQPQQDGSQMQTKLDYMVERLNHEVNLTADQQKKIRAIYEKTLNMAQAYGKLPRLIKGEDTRKRAERFQSQIKNLLTPAQQKKYNPQLPPEGTPMAPFDEKLRGMMIARLTSELNLTAEQQRKIEALYIKIFPETVRSSAPAHPQDMPQNTSQDEWKKRVEQTEVEIDKVLTPEQRKKYSALQEKRQPQGGNNDQKR